MEMGVKTSMYIYMVCVNTLNAQQHCQVRDGVGEVY